MKCINTKEIFFVNLHYIIIITFTVLFVKNIIYALLFYITFVLLKIPKHRVNSKMLDFFIGKDIKIIYKSEIPKDKSYILGYHPHGIYTLGLFRFFNEHKDVFLLISSTILLLLKPFFIFVGMIDSV
jgi:Diacylglycerol acyltransferase